MTYTDRDAVIKALADLGLMFGVPATPFEGEDIKMQPAEYADFVCNFGD